MKIINKIFYIVTEYYVTLLKGLKNTLVIAILAFIIGILIGFMIAIIRVAPKKDNIFLKFINSICKIYVSIIRGTPIVVQLLLIYFGVLVNVRAIIVAIIVFGLNSSAYMSEIIRSGIQSIDNGQMEAGRSLGLNYSKTMVNIIFPQAIKNTIPTILNELIALLKETSVVGYIAVIDVTVATQRIISNEYEALVPYIVLALIYFLIVSLLSLVVKILERRLRRSDSSI